MGEQVKFAKFVFNDASDVATFESGKAGMIEAAASQYAEAIAELKAAALAGELQGVGAALAKISEVSEQLVALGQAASEAAAFAAPVVAPE